MGVCAVAVAWFPLLSISSLPSKSYNEGWNAYRQWMTVQGLPLYGSPSALWTTNYPFLSFHIIGLLGGVKARMVLAGRAVCFTALVAVAGLTGGIVRTVTGARAGAVYAGLLLFAGIGAFNGAGRAVDDPEFLSAAFSMLALFAYVREPRWVGVAAVCFAVSLFTKHDLVAFPLAVALHMMLTRDRRGLAVFLGTGAVAAGGLLLLSYDLDGRWFFTDLLRPRAYSWENMRTETWHYLLHFAVPLVIGVMGLWHSRGLLLTLLVVSNVFAAYFSGGDGVGANIFYPALIADILACVVAICTLEDCRAALAVTTLAVAIMVPFQMRQDVKSWSGLAAETAAARQAVALLAVVPAPAICEDLLLCYEAGKPMDYDPYYVRDKILTGRVREDDILAMLRAGHYAAIQLDHRDEGRFTPGFMRVLRAQYRPVMTGSYYSVFVPMAASSRLGGG